MAISIVFFGSFQHYSGYILQSFLNHPDIDVTAVVTTPPMPVGRKQIITKTPVHEIAELNHIPVFTPVSLENSFLCAQDPQGVSTAKSDVGVIEKPDFFITAGYGKILPSEWLEYPRYGALNLHFSLLPAYRGANPAEWAIMCNESQTGITLMHMNEGLDKGDIITQASLPIEATDTRETVYEKLYKLGAEKLPLWLIKEFGVFSAQGSVGSRALQNPNSIQQPPTSPTPYAALLKRDDGFVPWPTIQKALRGESLKVDDFPSIKLQKAATYALTKSIFLGAQDPQRVSTAKSFIEFVERLPRALATYPSLWTIVPTLKGEKRMKIISFDLLPRSPYLVPNIVQIEGQQPTSYKQIKNQII